MTTMTVHLKPEGPVAEYLMKERGEFIDALMPFALFAKTLMERDDVLADVASISHQHLVVGALQKARRALIANGVLVSEESDMGDGLFPTRTILPAPAPKPKEPTS